MTKIDIHFDYSRVRGSTEMHNKFQKEFEISVSRRYENVMVIPYDVKFVRAYSQPDICFQMNRPGILDTIVFGNGWYLLVDMKTGKSTLQENQKNVQKRIEDINKGYSRAHKINTVSQGLMLINEEIKRER